MRLRWVIGTLIFALLVFTVTHVAKFPGTVSYFREVTGGQDILDLRASKSADETYQRLDAMGEAGRDAYLRLIFVVDLIFPLSVFVFLFALNRYTGDALQLAKSWRRVLIGLPIAYLTLDFTENILVFLMLSNYPQRLELAGGIIGLFTVGKRMAMVAAFFAPVVAKAIHIVRSPIAKIEQ